MSSSSWIDADSPISLTYGYMRGGVPTPLLQTGESVTIGIPYPDDLVSVAATVYVSASDAYGAYAILTQSLTLPTAVFAGVSEIDTWTCKWKTHGLPQRALAEADEMLSRAARVVGTDNALTTASMDSFFVTFNELMQVLAITPETYQQLVTVLYRLSDLTARTDSTFSLLSSSARTHLCSAFSTSSTGANANQFRRGVSVHVPSVEGTADAVDVTELIMTFCATTGRSALGTTSLAVTKHVMVEGLPTIFSKSANDTVNLLSATIDVPVIKSTESTCSFETGNITVSGSDLTRRVIMQKESISTLLSCDCQKRCSMCTGRVSVQFQSTSPETLPVSYPGLASVHVLSVSIFSMDSDAALNGGSNDVSTNTYFTLPANPGLNDTQIPKAACFQYINFWGLPITTTYDAASKTFTCTSDKTGGHVAVLLPEGYTHIAGPTIITGSSSSGSTANLLIYAGAAAAGLIFLALLIWCCLLYRRRRAFEKMRAASSRRQPGDMEMTTGISQAGLASRPSSNYFDTEGEDNLYGDDDDDAIDYSAFLSKQTAMNDNEYQAYVKQNTTFQVEGATTTFDADEDDNLYDNLPERDNGFGDDSADGDDFMVWETET
jgi:hypothetical protein